MSIDLWLNLLGIFASAAGVYAAIRADLTKAIITAEHAHDAALDAHERINLHIDSHH